MLFSGISFDYCNINNVTNPCIRKRKSSNYDVTDLGKYRENKEHLCISIILEFKAALYFSTRKGNNISSCRSKYA